KVLTILESKRDCEFNLQDYHEIWKLQSKSELPCVALSYISLIKPYLSESVREQIDLLEVKRFKKINHPISLYGMLDVIKLNLYLRHYNEKNKYESMLNKILEVRPDFVLIEQNIDDSLNSSQPLSLSLAISEIQLLLEVYMGIKHVSIRR
ncbi:TPA: hypothetical protein ACQXRR_002092, partial [Streptococcus pneumoniae]